MLSIIDEMDNQENIKCDELYSKEIYEYSNIIYNLYGKQTNTIICLNNASENNIDVIYRNFKKTEQEIFSIENTIQELIAALQTIERI